MQPGDTIHPGQPVEPTEPKPEADQPKPESAASWVFDSKDDKPQANHPPVDNQTSLGSFVSWTASEFINHQKNGGWYLLLIFGAVLLSGLAYLLTRDLISSVIILVVGVIMGVFAGHKPRTLEYKVDDHGIVVGSKSYPYSQFKSFSVVDEGAVSSVFLMPLKRFMPPITIYYDRADEDKIMDVISAHLPYEEHKEEFVDQLMRRIGF